MTKLAEADLSDENRKAIVDKCEYVAQFFKTLKQELETRPKHEDASVTLEAVNTKIDLLEAETRAIFNLPPPKKEEPV